MSDNDIKPTDPDTTDKVEDAETDETAAQKREAERKTSAVRSTR